MRHHRFAVIGSNCFTGSHFVDALLADDGNEVLGLSRSPEKDALYLPYKTRSLDHFRFRQANLSDDSALLALLDEFQPEVVINVAALSEVVLSNFSPIEYFETNTVGVVKLCSRLREKAYLKRYVHISSAEIYGSCPHPITEEQPLNPSTPYAVSKAAADMYLLTLAKNFDFPVTLVRSTNVYGKHQQLFKIIPRTAIYIKQGRKIDLHGGGRAVKSFVHIRDVVRGTLMALEQPQPDTIYHFSTRSDATIADIVRTVCDQMGEDFAANVNVVDERLGQDARYTLDFTKAERELGWEPQVKFEDGVRETIDWINENWDRVRSEPLQYVHKV